MQLKDYIQPNTILDEEYLLTAAPPDLVCGVAPLGPPAPTQPPLLGLGLFLSAAIPDLGCGVAPPGCHPWPQAGNGSSRPLLLTSDLG